MFPILKKRWWKYLLLGLVDVEANYTVVKAYQYTTLTSIQVRTTRGCVCVCLYVLVLCVCELVCLLACLWVWVYACVCAELQ
jgi:solute carrier family 35 protein F1/2